MTHTELIEWGLNPNYITPEFLESIGCTATLPSRFVKKVTKTDDCWIWTGNRNKRGYGSIGKGVSGAGSYGAHVASFILHKGKVDSGNDICHHCDNPSCVNPNHLFQGSTSDNMMDASKKGRAKGINSERKRLGDTAPFHKLNTEKVIQIANLRKTGMTYKGIASTMKMPCSTVSMICQGYTWSHVTGIPRKVVSC